MTMLVERLCIIGVGLIGGSVARAARQNRVARYIIGVDSDRANLRAALDSGVIDEAHGEVGERAALADLVVIATPVGGVPGVLAQLKGHWRDATVYSDAGSTKRSVLEAAAQVFGAVPDNFVPAHPIAGAEQSGVLASRADLYAGKRVIVTPTERTDPTALNRVTAFWKGLGATVSTMHADHHDAVLAATSHLPHVLAFVLTAMLGRRDETQEIFRYAAGGFRDFTRIASSDPLMWRDICVANGAQITPLIEAYCAELKAAASLIETGDAAALHDLFAEARAARQRFLDQMESPIPSC